MNSLVSLLISTANERIKQVKLIECSDVEYIVVHQCFDSEPLNPVAFSHCPANRYKLLLYPGLSKSRNSGLELCSTMYAYIMDDDVDYDLDRILELVERMQLEQVDVATCQFRYANGSLPKAYAKQAFEHTMLSAAKVASIEMCINIESINKHNIRFDEQFGLGTKLPSGEEYIFLTDCLKSGLKVKYFPIVTGIHPNETSGLDFYTEFSKTLAKRKMFQRIFNWKSVFFIIFFWIKKLPTVLSQGYGWQFTKAMLFGIK